MNDLMELATVRDDVAPISQRARLAGRRQLELAMAGPTQRRSRRTRLVLAATVAAAIVIGVFATQVVTLPGQSPTTAEAAEVLVRAAAVAAAEPALKPRPDQFIYQQGMQVTSDADEQTRFESWVAVDGSRAGLERVRGARGNEDQVIEPYRPEGGLEGAPYAVLAKLPTDPDELLARLYADPSVVNEVASHPERGRELAVWDLMRGLVNHLPTAQRAALFRAAAKVPGIERTPVAADADGRTGVAVGLKDPRLHGRIDFVFDASSYKFLGERVFDVKRDAASFNSTIRRTAVVNRVGQRPN